MKKVFCLFILCFFLPVSGFSQTFLLEENFNYQADEELTAVSNWSESPSGRRDIEVVEGSLSYNDYPSSSIGNKIFLDGGNDNRSGVRRNFSTISANGSSVYASFLMELVDLSDLDDSDEEGDYFFNFQSSGSANRAFIYIKQSETENKFNIGLAKSGTSGLTYFSDDLDLNTTYLIAVSYTFQPGDDEVRLWINPGLSGTEPSSALSVTSGSDTQDITYIQFRQREHSGDINIDGIRVSDSWQQAPLPIELASFTASVINNKILLNWKTTTEVNNYSFEIERKIKGESEWSKIVSVLGSGNSNSEKEYEFIDNSVSTTETYMYRLKQIDFDGKFEYSNILEVSFAVPSKFELFQNYPNPFNPNTNIHFSVPQASYVTLEVFNTMGERVSVLVSEELQQGSYNYVWDALTLASGIYYYKLQTDAFVETKKMVLMR